MPRSVVKRACGGEDTQVHSFYQRHQERGRCSDAVLFLFTKTPCSELLCSTRVCPPNRCHVFSLQMSILKRIGILNPDCINVVKFFEQFEYMGQTCLVFEMLDRSLYDLIDERREPLHLAAIRLIAEQVCIFVIWIKFSSLHSILPSVTKTLT